VLIRLILNCKLQIANLKFNICNLKYLSISTLSHWHISTLISCILFSACSDTIEQVTEIRHWGALSTMTGKTAPRIDTIHYLINDRTQITYIGQSALVRFLNRIDSTLLSQDELKIGTTYRVRQPADNVNNDLSIYVKKVSKLTIKGSRQEVFNILAAQESSKNRIEALFTKEFGVFFVIFPATKVLHRLAMIETIEEGQLIDTINLNPVFEQVVEMLR